ETLLQHTSAVVLRLWQLKRRLPEIENFLNVPNFWETMFWAAWFHDFGKAASGFQNMLATGKSWGYRHEVLSLGFLHWVFEPDTLEHTIAIAAIASHHRDHDIIFQEYIRYPENSMVRERWDSEMEFWRVEELARMTKME